MKYKLPLIKRVAYALWLVLIIGCGSSVPVYEVTGEVVFPDGKPLTTGMVEFRSIDLPLTFLASGPIGKDGKFRLEGGKHGAGATPAKYKVIVVVDKVAHVDRQTGKRKSQFPIAAEFRDYQSTPLEFRVTDNPANNHFRIQVRSPK
ncbi:MAG: hypothetical protein SFX18_07440 [Pirellulales bacterium]|nr:hypothetical protein [Pirellulales bacterium]